MDGLLNSNFCYASVYWSRKPFQCSRSLFWLFTVKIL